MCLLTTKSGYINKDNITCYKIVIKNYKRDKLFSLYYKFEYKLNKLYTNFNNLVETIYSDDKLVYRITSGFYHAFMDIETTEIVLSSLITHNSIPYCEIKVVKCTIPKGSVCFDNSKEICSNNIIINDVLSI